MYACSTISPAVRLRPNPSVAVAQNVQSSAQPTCDEMHCVTLSPSGMMTLSIARPSAVVIRSFRVPSVEVWTRSTVNEPIASTSASFPRKAFDSVVKSSHRRQPRAWRPWKI